MGTAVVENLDYTNIDRFERRPNDENANIGENNKSGQFKYGSSALQAEVNTLPDNLQKNRGRFKQVAHAYLGFSGAKFRDHPKQLLNSDENRDFVVCSVCCL